MSRTSRVLEGFVATNFANTFATAMVAVVEKILPAREQQAGNQQNTLAISPALARTGILDYSTGLVKATESFPTIFSIRKPKIRVFSTN
jgi:hypothetical protein